MLNEAEDLTVIKMAGADLEGCFLFITLAFSNGFSDSGGPAW